MGRIFPFITVHEYRVGRSLANRCIPISTLVRGKALCSPYLGICWVGVYMFWGKGIVNIAMYINACMGHVLQMTSL